jgi:hypothetical protein
MTETSSVSDFYITRNRSRPSIRLRLTIPPGRLGSNEPHALKNFGPG